MKVARIRRSRCWKSSEEKLKLRLERIEFGLRGPSVERIKRLVAKLVPGNPVVRVDRLYPSTWQRAEGAWSWAAQLTVGEIGSQWPMSEVLKWNPDKIEIYNSIPGQICLYPPLANQGGAANGS